MTNSSTVIGAGAWGTALATVLSHNAEIVKLFGRDEKAIQAIESTRINERYLPGIRLPNNIQAVDDISKSQHHGLLVLAIPFQSIRTVLSTLGIRKDVVDGVVCASKGIEAKSHSLAHIIVAEELGKDVPFAMLSGPNFASEVAERRPAAVTVASENPEFAKQVTRLFHTDFFRPYLSNDVVGVQIGGAVKNVMAIAAGIADGLDLGANARAALITRGLAEIARWGVKRGGRMETFMGLSGLGDLILTCTDDKSRNRRFGLQIAAGRSVQSAIDQVGLVEGVQTALAIAEIAYQENVEMPIAMQVAAVVKEKISPREAVKSLLDRDLSTEL